MRLFVPGAKCESHDQAETNFRVLIRLQINIGSQPGSSRHSGKFAADAIARRRRRNHRISRGRGESRFLSVTCGHSKGRRVSSLAYPKEARRKRGKLNDETVYNTLRRRKWIASDWRMSENNLKAKYYSITKNGRKRLARGTENWELIAGVVDRLLRL